MGLAMENEDNVVPFSLPDKPELKKKNYKDKRLLIVMPFDAWQDKRLSHLQIRVLMGFCSYTKRTGQVFNDNNDSAMTYVSQKRISEEMGISRQTINKSVKKLRECGYIVFEGKRGIPGLKGKTMRVVFGRDKKEKTNTLPQIKSLLSTHGDYRDKTDKEIEDQEILEKIKKGEIEMKMTSGVVNTQMKRLKSMSDRGKMDTKGAKDIIKRLKDAGQNVDNLLKEHDISNPHVDTHSDEVCKPNDVKVTPTLNRKLNPEVDTNNGFNNVYITYKGILNKHKTIGIPEPNETDQLLTTLLLEHKTKTSAGFITFMRKELEGGVYVSYTRLLEAYLSGEDS